MAAMAILIAQFGLSSAKAVEIEKLVMPGEVVRSHADIEGECTACHAAFQKENQDSLCRDCHEDIDEDLSRSLGFHGRSDEVAQKQCRDCHTEHIGRDGDIVNMDENSFNHEMTDFPLSGKHNEVECVDCHVTNKKFREAPADCVGCHRDDDVHKGNLGDNCADCHTEVDWKSVEFDHDTTDYPLLGKHREVECLSCHEDETFSRTPVTCYGCHAEDDAHNGRSGKNCGSCHNPRDWLDTSFDHDRDTSFPLDGGHATLTCDDCHSPDPFSDELDGSCLSCHADDDHHDGHFGEHCETCHVTESWPEVSFDHDRDTEFVLRGAHIGIDCVDCHVEPVFDVSPGVTCIACHEKDDVHNGEQGTACNDCHNENDWTEAVAFDHGFTRFPLLGKHKDVQCEDCHETHEFRLAETECLACHAEDNPHSDRYGDACGLCHSPVGWERWRFDHNAQTDFVLSGAHAEVACDDCHRQSLSPMDALGDQCGGCHKLDDVHDGEFGTDCGRCHRSTTFRDVRAVR